MRPGLSITLFVAASLFIGLARCAADYMKSSSEPLPTSIAQAEEGIGRQSGRPGVWFMD